MNKKRTTQENLAEKHKLTEFRKKFSNWKINNYEVLKSLNEINSRLKMTNLSELEDSSVDYPFWVKQRGEKIEKCLRSLGDLWNNIKSLIKYDWDPQRKGHTQLYLFDKWIKEYI